VRGEIRRATLMTSIGWATTPSPLPLATPRMPLTVSGSSSLFSFKTAVN
jgi:hypothetical protein